MSEAWQVSMLEQKALLPAVEHSWPPLTQENVWKVVPHALSQDLVMGHHLLVPPHTGLTIYAMERQRMILFLYRAVSDYDTSGRNCCR